MFRIWIVSSLLVAAACGFAGKKIKILDAEDMVFKAGDYLINHNLTQMELPNVGILPLDAVKLRKGVLQGLATVNYTEAPLLSGKTNHDNSVTYKFYVKLELDELNIQYDFELGPHGHEKEQTKGLLSVITLDNGLLFTGRIVMGAEDSCDLLIKDAAILEMKDNIFTITPRDIPELSHVTETIRGFIEPKLFSVTQRAFRAVVQNPRFQQGFADFVCQQVNQL